MYYPHYLVYPVAPYPTVCFVVPPGTSSTWSSSSTSSQLPPKAPTTLHPPIAPYGLPIPLPPIQLAEKRAARTEAASRAVPHRSATGPSASSRYYPHVHRLIALTEDPKHVIPFVWDVAHSPKTLQLREYTVNAAPDSFWEMFSSPAARLAPHNGGQPLRSLTLVIPDFPMWIDVYPLPTSPRSTQFGCSPYVTVWDLLLTLYSVLWTPIGHKVLASLSGAEYDAISRSAAQRARWRTVGVLYGGDHAAFVSTPRKIDFLGKRRIFLGIRVAQKPDLPDGKSFGEVFSVELGKA